MQAPFVGYHPDFLKIVGEDSRIKVIAQDPDGKSRFHEAGVWVPSINQVYITSNRMDDQVSLDPLSERVQGLVDMLLIRVGQGGEAEVTMLPPSAALPAANGACLYNGNLLVCDQGYGESQTSQLSILDPSMPFSVTPILNNFYGRPFNSLNDVITLPDPRTDGAKAFILFTDPQYGYEQGFKPSPCLPAQVYCFDPVTGAVRVICDGFKSPNGIAIDSTGTKCYVTDTGMIHGSGKINPTRPGHIYLYDIVFPSNLADGPTLVNRSVFAMTDSGAPDGIKLDTAGNVYAGCFDGVHIWNPHGTLLGKMLFPSPQSSSGFSGCANFCFIPDGRMVCMSEDRLILVEGLSIQGAGL
ncbi:hypothetical protein NliqN6_3081 [Naganishia liquefaciens]|uniref:SMP-30/Gluconolactonase/LRE-like region domain-containing protein n=1 Tax=Naganishia liquefaciens TaxID=104408 RepID=A0A8H3YEN9_9TREE|nr:hypothetical protein NliqN6_3081 [Naganishia liquefaciens]